MSGNTVWPQASGFQKLAKMDHFRHFWLTFVHSKCKRSSLRSQCWMRLFLWFSNTMLLFLLGSTNGQHSRRTSHVNNPGDPVHTVPSITCTRVETHHDQATSHRRVSEHPTPGKMPNRPRARSTTIELAHKVRCKYVILHSKWLMNAIL